MAVADYYSIVQTLYVSYFGRPADPVGLQNFAKQMEALNAPTTLAELNAAAAGNAELSTLINSFSSSDESKDLYGTGSTVSFVAAIYDNLLNRAPDAEGLLFWVNAIDSGQLSRANASIAIADATQSNTTAQGVKDAALINAKVAIASAFTTSVNTGEELVAYQGPEAILAGRELLGGVNSTSTVANTQAAIDLALEDLVGGPNGGDSKTLTDGIDNVSGNTANDVFTAPTVQNQNGELVNTFETGDTIVGGAGTDTLNIVLTASQGADDNGDAPAISATTTAVEIVNIRTQYGNNDVSVNDSHIDAELMAGVTQFWSDNSRTTLQIEDVRILPEQLTFGMRQTDPFAGYEVYFDPAQLADDRGTAGNSSLTLTLLDNANPTAELSNFSVNGVVFKLDGQSYTVNSAALGTADTYAAFVTALQAALDANPALAELTVTLNANNSITVTDPAGAAFEPVGYTWVDNVVPANGNLQWQLVAGAPVVEDAPVTTAVVLDAVGRTSQGGVLDIGSMADGGVEVFNISVDRSSWLSRIESQEDFGSGDHHLDTVNLTSIGANGNLTAGTRSTALDDGRVVAGLHDVRQVTSAAFTGTLNLGIELTADAIERYLDLATGEVVFSYAAGAGNDTFTIQADASLTDDADFAMDVTMGAGDDRLNLDVVHVNNVTVDGGTGVNTIAVARSHGTNADNTFEGFTNFTTYEVEAFDQNTTHDFIAANGNMAGVTRVNVATFNGAWDTTLIDTAAAADLFITGKNQTRGNNSNADQAFGLITLRGTEGAATDNTLTVTLQNTARIDGDLTVAGLVLNDVDGGNISNVGTLNIVSAGARSTSNEIGTIDAERVSTFNLSGTQDLTARIDTGANFNAGGVPTSNLTITGATLTGDLDLTVAGGLITTVDTAASAVVSITGTAGSADRLTIDGAGLDINTDTTVNAFETVRFTATGGDVDNTNFNGVNLYDIESAVADFTLRGLEGTEEIRINTDLASVEGNNLTFIASGQDTDSVLDLNFVDADTNTDEAFNDFSAGGSQIFIQDFREVNLTIGGEGNVDEVTTFDLNFRDEDGVDDADPAYDITDVFARELTVVGGGDQGAAGSAGGVDTLNLGTLSTILTQIDVSGYDGVVNLTLNVYADQPAPAAFDRNTTITLNGYEANITEVDLGADGHITTFVFTEDAVADTEDVTIIGFDAFNTAGIDLGNLSVLDLSRLGIDGLADLTIVQDGADTIVTANEDSLDFEIVLVGVSAADLSNENFRFA